MTKNVFMCCLMLIYSIGSAQSYLSGKIQGKRGPTLTMDWSEVQKVPMGLLYQDMGFQNGVNGLMEACSYLTESNNFERELGEVSDYIVANDFYVEGGKSFTPTRLTFNVWEFRKTRKVTIWFYDDEGGVPGKLITRTQPIVPSEKVYLGPSGTGYLIYKIVVDLPGTLTLIGGSSGLNYWVGITVENDNVALWEGTSIMNSQFGARKTEDGVNWDSTDSFDGVFELEGECHSLPQGCVTAVGQYPEEIFTPSCAGYPELITNEAFYGEYSKVNVLGGNLYIFKTNNPTDVITIANEEGTFVFSTGYGTVIWYFPANMTIRFYTHADEVCSVPIALVSRYVQCGNFNIVNYPEFSCYQGDGLILYGGENGANILRNSPFEVADDFIVPAETMFRVKQIRLNVFSETSITQGNLRIFKDDNGAPGELIHNLNMTPSLSRIVNTAGIYKIFELTYDLPNQLEFLEGTYWLSPALENQNGSEVFWEVTSQGYNGSTIRLSDDYGQNWVGEENFNYQAVFFISGRCLPVDVGCLDAPNGMYPDFVYTPTCTGNPETITHGNNAAYGSYSKMEVQEGVEYKFWINKEAFITLSNEEGNEILAADYDFLTWTAPFTGVIRFYTHFDENCEILDYILVDRFVQCGERAIIEEPDFECFQGDGITHEIDGTLYIHESHPERIADDFTVAAGTTFELKQIRMKVVADEPVGEMEFKIWDSLNGVPGEVLHEFYLSPAEVKVVGVFMYKPVYELTFDLENPILFEEGTYWLNPIVASLTPVSWESTFSGSNGSAYAYTEDGLIWNVHGSGQQMVFFVAGDCESLLGTDDLEKADFAYYPNPVKDVLHFQTKKFIESVEIFNWAGQRVMNLQNVQERQIHLSHLNAGTYLVKVVLAGGQIETFKIILK